jgi:hypothetical protein
MLDYLIHKASDRKFRLFAVACCRRIWVHVRDGRVREAVEVAERFAEGRADKQDLRTARRAMTLAQRELHWRQRSRAAGFALRTASAAVADQAWDAARRASWESAWASTPTGPNQPEERGAHAELVREVFGNPFAHPLGGVAQAGWLSGEVFHEAERIYADQLFDRLPGLAEPLERAGCDDVGLLAHLRKSGSHWRGCWALDRLTGRW